LRQALPILLSALSFSPLPPDAAARCHGSARFSFTADAAFAIASRRLCRRDMITAFTRSAARRSPLLLRLYAAIRLSITTLIDYG